MEGNVLHQVSNGAEEVRSVYNQAHKLVDCSVTTNQMQVKAFMHVCRLGLEDQRTNPEYRELSFVDMTEAKVNCQSFQRTSKRAAVESAVVPTAQTREKTENHVHKKDEQVLQRSKRGFTYPGTLWCGAGNMADNYDDLGEFAATDSCCRVHDHCPYVIHAFSSNYGYTNFKWHPLSHCDCDNALKDCLRKVNDTSSRVVGQAFFNVLEVPCFEFKYEEQCVERHWYGACKRYDMLPFAVPTESIPYDFGGIDVIDVLTLAPLVQKKKKTGIEQDQTEGPTQSTVSGSPTSGPEEPSLRNVFTAAEDFIKVLATVSTSQGTATDTTKGETQTSEKKKRKNPAGAKRKTKKRKGKGKGRKKKQKIFSKGAEEGITVTVTPTKAEEVVNKSNFVNEPEKVEQLNGNVKSFTDGEKDLGGKDKFINDVMRDEPRVDDQSSADASVNSVAAVKKEQNILENLALMDHTEAASPSTATASPIVTTQKAKRQRSRKGEGRKTQSNITLTAPTNRAAHRNAIKGDLPAMTTENSGTQTMPASAAVISAEQPEKQRLERQSEKGPVTAMASPISSIVTAIKTQRSKKSEERNKRRKITSFLPVMGVIFQNTTEVNIKVIPTERTSTPAVNSNIAVVNITVSAGQSVSHRPESYIDKGPTVNLSAVKSKRHRPNESEGRKIRRKKIAPTLSFEGSSLQNNIQKALETLNTDISGVPNIPTTTSVVTAELTERLAPQSTENQRGKGRLTFTASRYHPREAGRTLGSKEREGRKNRKEMSMPTVVTEKAPVHNDTATELEDMTTTYLTASASTILSGVDQVREFSPQRSENQGEQAFFHVPAGTPTMDPTQFTIQETKRLGRKKRRKPPHTDSY
ncbi:uncharacterized protein proca1 isoform X2 [Esox lucius]|nr:uncharacterized protein proca1 isoform X2 [Esox lucius]